MGLRRALARRQREAHKHVWPINEAAGQAPEGWPGWPDGKKFAFVLTHDVEGYSGLTKCRQLMRMEMEFGFRSSFNFIPEGDYAVPPELRTEFTLNGFEVGVQDLHHDGKLYRSRREFAEKAERIKCYLKEWGACGFRSGFMLHKLDWLHDLQVQYDASTFDTDPFEPQPDGMNTIFPFWVSGADGSGYVELPYTLVQDFTLLVLLQEPSTEIWKRKLRWIASRGGMALLIVHPDYMAMGGTQPARNEFHGLLYEEFLRWVKETYAGQYWHVLPKTVAAFYRQFACSEPKLFSPRGRDSGESPARVEQDILLGVEQG